MIIFNTIIVQFEKEILAVIINTYSCAVLTELLCFTFHESYKIVELLYFDSYDVSLSECIIQIVQLFIKKNNNNKRKWDSITKYNKIFFISETSKKKKKKNRMK